MRLLSSNGREVSTTASPAGATHEVIGIDRRYNMPTLRLIYKGQKLAYKLVIKNLQIKTPSAAELSV